MPGEPQPKGTTSLGRLPLMLTVSEAAQCAADQPGGAYKLAQSGRRPRRSGLRSCGSAPDCSFVGPTSRRSSASIPRLRPSRLIAPASPRGPSQAGLRPIPGHAGLALLDLLGVDPQQGVGRVAEAGGNGDRVVTVAECGAGGPVAKVVEHEAARPADRDASRLPARMKTSYSQRGEAGRRRPVLRASIVSARRRSVGLRMPCLDRGDRRRIEGDRARGPGLGAVPQDRATKAVALAADAQGVAHQVVPRQGDDLRLPGACEGASEAQREPGALLGRRRRNSEHLLGLDGNGDRCGPVGASTTGLERSIRRDTPHDAAAFSVDPPPDRARAPPRRRI